MHSKDTIHSLWIGGSLSLMEQLTLSSFVAQEHSFCLWHYHPITSSIPKGVQLLDAREIIPEDQVFAYKNKNQYGHGQGSFSGFSDLFRYKLLFEKGGWWVDMDVTCLQPFPQHTDYFFRTHHEFPMVGNVMKTPKNCPAMKAAYEASLLEVHAENRDWNAPIRILNEQIKAHHLEQYIYPDSCNRDWFLDLLPFLFTRRKFPENWLFVHWTNENFRSRNWDKNAFLIGSTYGKLLSTYGLVKSQYSIWERLKNSWTFYQLRKALN